MLSVNITKNLGDFSLNIVLEAREGITALFGPSGSGKSLTLKSIAGLLTPDQGQIRLGDLIFFDDRRRINLPPQKRKVGYVFQNYALFPHLTVYQNIAYGIKHLPKKEQRERVYQLLQKTRLIGLENKKPPNLSGGQQQRVALARALAPGPRLLLLDEPFSALDSAVKSRLRAELLDLLAENPIPTIFVTHSLDEAYSLSRYLAVIEGGRIIQQGEKEEVLTKPVSKQVARLTRTKNVFSGQVLGPRGDWTEIQTPDFSLLVSQKGLNPGQEVTVAIRPHQLRLYGPGQSSLPPYNCFSCTLVKTITHADSFTLFLRLSHNHQRDYHFFAKVSSQLYQELRLDHQNLLYCHLPPEEVAVIPEEK